LLFTKRKSLLPDAVQTRMVEAIRAAESTTTGEIRVFIEPRCAYMDAMDRARELFAQLGMEATERRNAVLLYLATKDHQFAIFGDVEIYTRAGGPAFWQEAAANLQRDLRAGAMEDGLCHCIETLGRALAQHFPYDPTVTRNELPDEIVFGK
jgi:uncharacterized membrane protein